MSKREDTEGRAEIRKLEKQIDRNYFTRPSWAERVEAIARKHGFVPITPAIMKGAKPILETLKADAERADPEAD